MSRRVIDVALLAGLVVVAGAIVWTLFSLGADTGPVERTPTASQAQENGGADPANGDGGIVPVAPDEAPEEGDDANGGGNNVVALPPDGAEGEADAENGAEGNGADGADDADNEGDEGDEGEADGPEDEDGAPPEPVLEDGRPNPEVPAAQAPPVPASGPVPLGRVGFSFVTGGEGACGITLEAWEHVAVSRELLDAYGCGAEVSVTLDEETGGRTTVDAVVADTMNEARSRTVNIYVGEDEPALEYGLTAGTIEPR